LSVKLFALLSLLNLASGWVKIMGGREGGRERREGRHAREWGRQRIRKEEKF
jgi:hypothetical protein